MTGHKRRLSQQDPRAMGVSPGFMAHSIGPDGRARLEQLERERQEQEQRSRSAQEMHRLIFGRGQNFSGSEETTKDTQEVVGDSSDEQGRPASLGSADAGARTREEPPRGPTAAEQLRDHIFYGPPRPPAA